MGGHNDKSRGRNWKRGRRIREEEGVEKEGERVGGEKKRESWEGEGEKCGEDAEGKEGGIEGGKRRIERMIRRE